MQGDDMGEFSLENGLMKRPAGKQGGKGKRPRRAAISSGTHEDDEHNDENPDDDAGKDNLPDPVVLSAEEEVHKQVQKASRKLGTYLGQLLKHKCRIKVSAASRQILKNTKSRHTDGEVIIIISSVRKTYVRVLGGIL